jgi:hypothetical protein
MATADQSGDESSSLPPEIVTLDQGHAEPGAVTESVGEVLIRAGVPGKPDLKADHGKPYPNTTTDVAKLLTERGFTVTYEDERGQRSYVSFCAVEIWIPMLEFASSILGGISGNFFSDLIKAARRAARAAASARSPSLPLAPRSGGANAGRLARKAEGRAAWHTASFIRAGRRPCSRCRDCPGPVRTRQGRL